MAMDTGTEMILATTASKGSNRPSIPASQPSMPWDSRADRAPAVPQATTIRAIIMICRPRLLLLDEATAGLDPMVRDEILTVFAEFTRSEDHSILICSHIVSDLEKLCDYVAFLHRGKLQFWEEKDRLIESFGLWSCTPEQLTELDPASVAGREDSPYGVRALLRRNLVPDGLELERPSLEDIILLQVKGEKRK